jgi:hypothetical protein
MLSSFFYYLERTVLLDFRKWSWRQDITLLFYNLFFATLTTVGIILKLEGNLFTINGTSHWEGTQLNFKNAWLMTFTPVWVWSIGIFILLQQWGQNMLSMIANSYFGYGHEDAWPSEDRFFLK